MELFLNIYRNLDNTNLILDFTTVFRAAGRYEFIILDSEDIYISLEVVICVYSMFVTNSIPASTVSAIESSIQGPKCQWSTSMSCGLINSTLTLKDYLWFWLTGLVCYKLYVLLWSTIILISLIIHWASKSLIFFLHHSNFLNLEASMPWRARFYAFVS